MKRYAILGAAVLMQLCLGATYSWSVYVEQLRELTGLGQGLIQLPFTTFYIAFPMTMIAGGMLVHRWGPRRCAMLGGALFGGGWLLASLGGRHFGFTVAGIGLMAGMGVGMAYIVPISVSVRWFPNRKGLVTGVAVAGFGGGAALVTKIGSLLLASGRTPFETFGWLGAAALAIVIPAAYLMQNPPEQPTTSTASDIPDASDQSGKSDKKTKDFSLRTLPGQRDFRLLYAAMFAGLAAGFAVNANLKDLAPADSAARFGAAAVSLFALANALGRIIWGFSFDHAPRPARLISWNLWAQAAVLIAAPVLCRRAEGFLALALLTGFNYGGVLVLYAAAASRRWGPVPFSRVYGLLFSANIPAALAPLLAGLTFDATGGFTPSLYVIAALLVLAGLAFLRRYSANR